MMPRHEASEHLRVRGVHDGIDAQRRDITTPQTYGTAPLNGLDVIEGRRSPVLQNALQEAVLRYDELLGCRDRRAHVHQGPEQVPLRLGTRGNVSRPITLFEQQPDGHGKGLLDLLEQFHPITHDNPRPSLLRYRRFHAVLTAHHTCFWEGANARGV